MKRRADAVAEVIKNGPVVPSMRDDVDSGGITIAIMDNTKVPEKLIDLLVERGTYEEAILAEIKTAYDQKEQERVFALVGRLLYEGPGTLPKATNGTPQSL